MMFMPLAFNAFFRAVMEDGARRPAAKPVSSKQIQQGSFKASARRARRATATGTVSPLAGFCEFLRESKNVLLPRIEPSNIFSRIEP